MDTLGLLNALVSYVPEVVGAAAFISLTVDLAKKYLRLRDGYAGILSGALNLAAYIVYYFVEDKRAIDSVLQALTLVLPYLAMLLVSLAATKAVHKVTMWLGIGVSHPEV